jgi:hypothetical protein
MNKIILTIVILLIVVVLLSSYVAFYCLQPQLVSGKRGDLQQIFIIERYPGEGGGREGEPKSIITITDKKTMNAIYNELWRTFPIQERIDCSFYSMVSPRYELSIYYSDKTDEVSVYLAGATRRLERFGWITVSSIASARRITALLEEIIEYN